MKFRSIILQSGKTTTGIQVPAEIVTSLGPSKRPPVRVTINGYTYRSSIASMGGKYMLSVSAEVRKNARVAGGDKVEVNIELDTAPREVAMPSDFQKAFDVNVKAKKFFDGLSYSNKLRHVLSIEGAKTAETRQRRIAKAISVLKQGKV